MVATRGAQFREITRDSIDRLEWRMRKRNAPLWGRLNAHLSKPHDICLHFDSVLPEATQQAARRLGFTPLYVYRTGTWPFTTEIEVWTSPDYTTELTVLRSGGSGRVGRWSLDTWFTNDVGIATGQPMRGPQVTRQIGSTGDLEADWQRHQQAFRQTWPVDAVPFARGVAAASLKLIEYQNEFMADDSTGRSLIDLGFIGFIAIVSFLFVQVTLFAVS